MSYYEKKMHLSMVDVIRKTHMIPEEYINYTLIPLYKNKNDAQVYGNYRGIILLSHTMKLRKRVINMRIR